MVKFIQIFNYLKTNVTYIDQIAIAFVTISFYIKQLWSLILFLPYFMAKLTTKWSKMF
jgi:hypothetical protein